MDVGRGGALGPGCGGEEEDSGQTEGQILPVLTTRRDTLLLCPWLPGPETDCPYPGATLTLSLTSVSDSELEVSP